jgi:hypothetical protein
MRHCPYCAEQIHEAARICRFCNREVAPLRVSGRHADSEEPGLLRVAEVCLGVIAVAAVAYMVLTQLAPLRMRAAGASAGGDSAISAFVAPPPPPPPFVLPVLDSTFILRAGEHFDTMLSLNDDRPCTFSGRVTGVDGGNRDIEVFVLGEDAYANWHNGVRLEPLFASGRTSATTLNVPVPSKGKLSILISNRFSLFTDKRVSAKHMHVTCE